MARLELESAMKTLKLSVTAKFVPFSESRNNGEKHHSLNWKITVHKNGHTVLTTDYMAGSAYAPSYKQGDHTVDTTNNVKQECETGRCATGFAKQINPDSADVVYSLVSDTDVLNYGSFEEWASSFGYDADSKSAEKTYRLCLDIALKLHSVLGDDGLRQLQEASQDF